MIFHSIDYLVFLAILLPIYWNLSHRLQNRFLLAASLFFYGYGEPKYLLLLIGCAVVAWAAGLAIELFPKYRHAALLSAVGACFGTLFYFKYREFFIQNLEALHLIEDVDVGAIILPIGISFFTFQAVSYVLDIWRGEIQARKNFFDFFLFKAFFPQLVAGPIERAPHLLPQIEHRRVLNFDRFRDGIFLMLWGFFKKLVIADNVSIVADKIFALEDPTFPGLWAGVFAFAIQIYADFSAYTDIARGTSKLLGFELMQNFNHPYFAQSPQDFWRRWHISLSSWFRDYLYIPLGGSREGEWKAARNVIITFTLCGFWHGASWNFVFWGAYHGILLIGTRFCQRIVPENIRKQPVLAPLRMLLTFVLICIGWLIFRETNTEYLFRYLTLSPAAASKDDWQLGIFLALTVVFYSFPLWTQPVVEALWKRYSHRFNAWPVIGAQAVTAGILLFGVLHFWSTVSSDFIYFQF